MFDDTKKSMGVMFLILVVIVLVAMFMINNKLLARLITNERFDSGGYKLLYYSKTNCGYCDAFSPEWAKLTACVSNFTAGDGRNCNLSMSLEHRPVETNMADIDAYGITGVPALVLTQAGKFDQYAGVMKMPNVIAWLNALPATSSVPALPCNITCSVSYS